MRNAAGSASTDLIHVPVRRRAALVAAVSALVLGSAAAAMAQPGAAPMPQPEVAPMPPPMPPAGQLDPGPAPGTPDSPGGYVVPAPGAAQWPSVETSFVSATSMSWEVMVDQQSACWTPCELMLDGPHWITLRSRDRRPIRLEVGELGRAAAAVTAHDLKTGMYATGITFTALGGMALVTGITLTAVGCSTDRDGMCTAGLISGGAGAAVTLGGIWLMRQALPSYQVRALERRGLSLFGNGQGGGIAGKF